MDFHTILRSRCLITDGAMGTYYREKYENSPGAPELDNQTEPQKIEAVHREYIEAGADIIRTNSFASNGKTLCVDLLGETAREERLKRVYDNVQASCRIARSAVRKEREKAEKTGEIPKEVYIAGDIGPHSGAGRWQRGSGYS